MSSTLTNLALETSKTLGSKATTTEEVASCDKWKKYFDDGMETANGMSTSRAQKVGKWSLLSTDFTEPGGELTPTLKLKRNAQSALDLLVRLGAWKKHEDLALLRSGFPTRFTEKEHQYASDAIDDSHDPDRILGLRKDLRHLKVYTIDGEYTEEVDDGLSIEKIKKSDGTERKRIWIHIADADRWGKLKFA